MVIPFRQAIGWHRPLMWFATAMAAVAAVSAVGYHVDHRILVGVPIWAKPLLFSISFLLYAVTLAWLISRLQRPRVRRIAHRTGSVIAGATGLEMVAILTQVVRGQQSHFNYSTPVNALVFAAMGVFVVVIFLATIAVGIAFLIESPVGDLATTWAVRLGLAISVAGMSVGFLMLRPTPAQSGDAPIRGAHSVGVADGGPSMPLSGWNTTGGDLRIPHFVGLHALQALPLLALLLGMIPATARLTGGTRLRLVLVGAGGIGGLFALTLWQALRGQALTAPDAWTIGAAILLAAAVGGAAMGVVRGDRRRSARGHARPGRSGRRKSVTAAPARNPAAT